MALMGLIYWLWRKYVRINTSATQNMDMHIVRTIYITDMSHGSCAEAPAGAAAGAATAGASWGAGMPAKSSSATAARGGGAPPDGAPLDFYVRYEVEEEVPVEVHRLSARSAAAVGQLAPAAFPSAQCGQRNFFGGVHVAAHVHYHYIHESNTCGRSLRG